MPPLTNSSEGHADLNLSIQSVDRVDEDPISSKAQAQILLTALRNVIIPLIQTILPNQKDLQQIPFGPEAEDFLDALQKYITSIVRDQTESDNQAGLTRTVTSEEMSPTNLKQDEDTASSVSGANLPEPFQIGKKPLVIIRDPYRTERNFEEVVLDQVLQALRARVFNMMPIRLLFIEKNGSNLDIRLLDRTGIYSLLTSELRDRFRKTEFKDLTTAYLVETGLKWIPEITTSYTIMSHTWLRASPGEVTYSDWHQGTLDYTHPGYQKLVNFCRVSVEEHGLTLAWMDTICINKESSAELDESIRSMYKWYQNAKICIIHLIETTALSDMAKDPWFTRGWTLQELLAPKYIIFYGTEWTTLGSGFVNDKEDHNIQRQIELATTITPTELITPMSKISISRKMQWAAMRQVTREEDIAYSLMGVFNVSISIAYGEGAKGAFLRIIKEILITAKSEILDLFNWADDFETRTSVLIPSHPAAYLRRRDFVFGQATLIERIPLTHLGLRVPVVLMPAVPHRPHSSQTPYIPMGDYYSTVNIEPIGDEYAVLGNSLNVLDTSPSGMPSFSHGGAPLGFAFAVLNCGGFGESSILLFKHCFALAVLYSHDNGTVVPLGYKRKVPTKDPIFFQLHNNKRSTSQNDWEYDTVLKKELPRHGMQVLIMYL